METAELEITLHSSNGSGYPVELLFRDPTSAVETAEVASQNLVLKPRLLRGDPYRDPEYGRLLSGALFGIPETRRAFETASSVAASHGRPLRLRLRLFGAGDLHCVAWESLLHPADLDRSPPHPDQERRLATDENTLVCRLVGTNDYRPVRVRSRGDLRALVVVASPAYLEKERTDGLRPLDVPDEVRRAEEAFAGSAIPVTTLASPDATLGNIFTQLRDGYDILYLICHGGLRYGEPQLLLDRKDGRKLPVPGGELATRVRDLRRRPALMVLASCHSAAGVTAVGPRLAAAGVPAVLAMHRSVTKRTVQLFLPVFFQELLRNGEIDQATAAARAAVRQHLDSWMPILFLRHRNGRLFEEGDPRVAHWLAQLDRLRDLGLIERREHERLQAWERRTSTETVGRRLLLSEDVDDTELGRRRLPNADTVRRQQILIALRLGCDPRIERLGMRFVLVPPGTSQENRQGSEDPFFLAETPVSEAQWAEITGEADTRARDDRAKVGIDRSQICSFLERANRRLGKEARIGLPTPGQLDYALEIGEEAGSAQGATLVAPALRTREPSALGLHDLLGVVTQLCRSSGACRSSGVWRWWGRGYQTSAFGLAESAMSQPSRSSFEKGPERGFRPILYL